ncbi:MAG: hypothetical protein U0263_12700 [Polyangiaceae bacterium]
MLALDVAHLAPRAAGFLVGVGFMTRAPLLYALPLVFEALRVSSALWRTSPSMRASKD